MVSFGPQNGELAFNVVPSLLPISPPCRIGTAVKAMVSSLKGSWRERERGREKKEGMRQVEKEEGRR